MSNDWNKLNVKEKIMLVTTDILQLLDRLCEKTKLGGELDSVIETASESFDPLGELLQINLEEESDKSINLNALSQHILSGRSIIAPTVERLLGTSFKLATKNAEEGESNKSLSTSSQSEQIIQNSKSIELLARTNYRRHRDLVVEKVSSTHSPAKDLTQPGPSGLQKKRKDASVQETSLKQSSQKARQPEHSENLSQPGPSGITAFSKRAASPGKNEGNKSLSRSRNQEVNYEGNKRIELQTRRKDASVREQVTNQSFRGQPQPSGTTSEEIIEDREERLLQQLSEVVSQPGPSGVIPPSKRVSRSLNKSERHKRLSRRSQSEQVNYNSSKGTKLHSYLDLSDKQTKRKDASDREKFPQKFFRSVSQQGPSETSSIASREERQSRLGSEEASLQGSRERSKGFGRDMLPPRFSSPDQSEFKHSKRKTKSSDSKKTRESSSVYKSYTHYSPSDWETESESEDHRRSSTIY